MIFYVALLPLQAHLHTYTYTGYTCTHIYMSTTCIQKHTHAYKISTLNNFCSIYFSVCHLNIQTYSMLCTVLWDGPREQKKARSKWGLLPLNIYILLQPFHSFIREIWWCKVVWHKIAIAGPSGVWFPAHDDKRGGRTFRSGHSRRRIGSYCPSMGKRY